MADYDLSQFLGFPSLAPKWDVGQNRLTGQVAAPPVGLPMMGAQPANDIGALLALIQSPVSQAELRQRQLEMLIGQGVPEGQVARTGNDLGAMRNYPMPILPGGGTDNNGLLDVNTWRQRLLNPKTERGA